MFRFLVNFLRSRSVLFLLGLILSVPWLSSSWDSLTSGCSWSCCFFYFFWVRWKRLISSSLAFCIRISSSFSCSNRAIYSLSFLFSSAFASLSIFSNSFSFSSGSYWGSFYLRSLPLFSPRPFFVWPMSATWFLLSFFFFFSLLWLGDISESSSFYVIKTESMIAFFFCWFLPFWVASLGTSSISLIFSCF